MKKTVLQKLRLRWIIPAFVACFLSAGCADILQGPPVSPEAGRVVITIANPARTVAPQIDQFSKVEITFWRTDGSGILNPLVVTGGAAVIYLPPGTWELTASAYNSGEPPVIVAQAKNTLIRTAGDITGETNFVLAPTGAGNGTLEYIVSLPPGLEIEEGTIRIEQGGELLEEASLNGGGSGTFSLERGRYMVDIILDKGDGTTAVYREAAVILPVLVTIANFAPTAEDFLDPEARAALALALTFDLTANNSSHTRIEEAGGAGAFITQRLSAPRGTALVYFALKKTDAQTIAITGADAAKVTQVAADGSNPSATLAVFTVDTSDLPLGDRVFTLDLAELYKENVVITVTVTIGYIQNLYFANLPDKRIYIQGENFNPSGMVLAGTYADGSALVEPDLSGYVITGFDSSSLGEKTLYATVRGVTASLKSGYPPEGVSITVESSGARKIFFDYGLRHSAQDTQPNRYSVPLDRALVLAPVKWHIPDDAEYEWTVGGVAPPPTHPENPEYFRFTPGAQGNYEVTVTAKINGQAVSTASTTVECVAPLGSGGSGGGAATLYNQTYSPGQFTPGGGRELGAGPPWSLGAWGGYIIFKLRATSGIRIVGNAFETWSEPGTVWVMQDENGNGAPDDTWYELAGSHTLLSSAKRRYAVTYSRNPAGSGSVWTDNLGNIGTLGNYPTGYPSPMTFVGTGLPENSGVAYSGYVDVYGGSVFSLSSAIQVDGTPISLAYIDFVKVQTALNVWANQFGEVSTEIYEVPRSDSGGQSDPAMLLTGTNAGSGQYNYQFVNNSGYNLIVTLYPEPKFTLNAGASITKTIASGTAYYDYYGGNVTVTKTTGKVTFVDGPGGNI
jgi:hypothetical protein